MPLVQLFHSIELSDDKRDEALSSLKINMDVFMLDLNIETVDVSTPVPHYREKDNRTLISYTSRIVYHLRGRE